MLLLGCIGGLLPRSVAGFATAGLCGAGVLLCLPALLTATPGALSFPIGPPGLSLHLALDATATLFLVILFVCATAVAGQAAVIAGHPDEASSVPLCLSGLLVTVLAADSITLAVGLALVGAALWRRTEPRSDRIAGNRNHRDRALSRPVYVIVTVALLLIALSLITPAGVASDFSLIRAHSATAARLAAFAVLTGTAILTMLILAGPPADTGDITVSDALIAGGVIPAAIYLLVRLLLDLPGPAIQAWWGYLLLAAGAALAVGFGWRAVRHPDLGASVVSLVRQQSGLAVVGLGVTLIAKSADLPEAAASGLAATLLLALTTGVAGSLACLAGRSLADGAGTGRLARLGGLVHSMPIASAAFAAALFALSTLPPASGFAALWMLFQSLLSAPRTGGLISQVPMGLTAAAVAVSAALATASFIRLVGIVVLSRPRTVRGSAARDVTPAERPILWLLAAISLLFGILPGSALKVLASGATRTLIGTDPGASAGWMTLSATASGAGYAPLPVFAVLALVSIAVILASRGSRSGYRLAVMWSDGQPASADMPFGDPLTQSAGAGFLPALPELPVRRLMVPRHLFPGLAIRLPASLNRAATGLWIILLGLGAMLLLLSLSDTALPT